MNIDLITWLALLQSNSSLLVRVPKALVVLPNPVTEHKTQPDTTPVSWRSPAAAQEEQEAARCWIPGSLRLWHGGAGTGGAQQPKGMKGYLHLSPPGCLYLRWHVQPFREGKWITPCWVSVGWGEESEKRNGTGSSTTQVTPQTQRMEYKLKFSSLTKQLNSSFR